MELIGDFVSVLLNGLVDVSDLNAGGVGDGSWGGIGNGGRVGQGSSGIGDGSCGVGQSWASCQLKGQRKAN